MELLFSGMPIKLNKQENTLSFGKELIVEECVSKSTLKLVQVLAQPESASEEIAFRFYKGIHFEKDKECLDKYFLRYDITLLLPGLVGKERKKTSGHFHKLLSGSCYSHAELYEVVYGTALYILQPIRDIGSTGENMVVDEIILVRLNAGEKIVVPANCSHCTVNVGDNNLVFSNLVLNRGANEYGGIETHRGMGIYVLEKNGNLEIIPNPSYDLSKTKIYDGIVAPNEKLGTIPGVPVYSSFIQNPEKYLYLQNPGDYNEIINKGITAK